jgi:hypothetical protein
MSSTTVLVEDLLDRLDAIDKRYQKEQKVYNIAGIILSILDIAFGLLSLFYSALLITAVVASVLCGTVWGARTVQVMKIRQLIKNLKLIAAPGFVYIATRKKRGDLFMNIKIRNWIIAVLDLVAVVFGIAMVFIEPSVLTANIELVICGIGSLLGVNIAIPCFNNAKRSETEIAEKKSVKEGKVLLKQAKAREKEREAAEKKARLDAEVANIKKEQEAQEQSEKVV